MMQESSISVGDVVEVVTERLAFGGDAVAHHEGLAVFVPLAAPGERLRVRITERKKKFARATIEEILVASPARREAPCPHFGECGGCQLQHLAYPAQLEAKAGFARDCLSRIGRIEWPGEIEILSGPEFNYRAGAQVKLETVPSSEGEELKIGFNRAGSHSVCDVESCPILLPELDSALGLLRSSLKAAGDPTRSKRTIISEIEMAAGESGVAFEPALPGLPEGPIERSASGNLYSFSPSTFFQINPFLLEGLIAEATRNGTGKLAIDLYAGAGFFTLELARRYDRVIGVEALPRAASFARKNIRANGVSNAKFYTKLADVWLKEFAANKKRNPKIDMILLDPPRRGASECISHIVGLKPANITYVSCDPATLARDLRELLDGGYKLSGIKAFDLFPQTYHVEIVAHLSFSN